MKKPEMIIHPIVTERHVPQFIRRDPLMMEIFKAENKSLTDALWDINRLYFNMFIQTADVEMIRQHEKFWQITPPKGATVEDRRLAIMAKMASRTIYTKRSLHRMLSALCGADGFELTINYDRLHVKALVEKKTANQVDIIRKMLHDVLPANMTYEVLVRYNQHLMLAYLNHEELAQFTHHETRTGIGVKRIAESRGYNGN